MRRPEQYHGVDWDDRLWQVTRMLIDTMKSQVWDRNSIPDRLARVGTDAAQALSGYLKRHPELLDPLADHVALRAELADYAHQMMRTEDEALADLAAISDEEVRRYGTQSADHHQSSSVLVHTTVALTNLTCADLGTSVDVNPQKRAAVLTDGLLWVSPRRLDGALPGLLNPVGLWEIKEYWGGTSGGSKMSDAIYEIQLVGMELRAFEREHGIKVWHYALLDGSDQWASRRSDLRRSIDLLCFGLVDEVLFGREVLTEWPMVVEHLCQEAGMVR